MNFNTIKRIFQYLSYWFRHPHRKGHGIHSPFLFDFVDQVLYKKTPGNKHLKDIGNMRRSMLQDNTIIEIEDFGAGSSQISGNRRKISDIARHSSTSLKYGRLLYNLVNHYKPHTIIELGTCLGIGTMYLASDNDNSKVYTIEGSKSLAQKALQSFDQFGMTDIFPEQGNFDEVLPKILNEIGKFDLVFIDGNHKKEATLRYFKLLLPYLHSNSIIIFDDIRWSNEMEMAWCEIYNHKNIKLSIDLFNLGIVFFNEKLIKQHFEIYY